MSVPVPSKSAHPLEQRARRPIWARYPALAVTLLATLLSLLVTQPLFLKLSTAVYADIPGDALGTIYDFWWWSYAIHHGKSLFDNTLLGAPLGGSWDQAPFTVLQVAIFAPLSALAGSIVAYNLGNLASFPATALVTYLLARRLGLTVLASAFASLAFSFSPYHVEKAMGHLNQTHLEVFPALLLFLVRWRQGGSRWNLIWAGVIAGITIWTDIYYAFILAFLTIGFFAVSFLVASENGWGIVRRLLVHMQGVLVVGAVAALFLPLAVLVAHRPSASGYQQSLVTNIRTLERSLGDLQTWGLRPREFLLPWHSNPLTPARVRGFEQEHLHGSNPTENSMFLGYTVLLLAAVGVLAARRAFPILLGIAMILEGAILGLPPHFSIDGIRLIGPSLVLHRVVPFIRVYSRFGLLALLGATLLAGLGFIWVERHVRRQGLGWLTVIPFVLLALEFNNQPPSHVLTLFPAPEPYQWLSTQPAGILVEYPLAAGREEIQEVLTENYMFYQQVHEHPLFNDAVKNSRAHLLAPQFEPYYKPGVTIALQSLGIKYVFVHRQAYGQAGFQQPRSVPGLRFLESFGDADVFAVDSDSGV